MSQDFLIRMPQNGRGLPDALWNKYASVASPRDWPPHWSEKKRSRSRTRKLDGEAEARLITLACSDAPKGYARWTLQMLADQLIELDVVESISHECVRQVLKKHHQTLAESDVVHTGTG